ncbi:MAG: SurA N-terminal domain-containing protein [Endomicrobium sp.]|jgi:hypothetical protein|nr:SurA N-terminal domain-containing protein [Endomicrobium sp.]
MMNFLRKHMRKIFIITIVAFIGGTFMGFGVYFFGPTKDFDTAVNINGTKVTLKFFSSIYTASVDMYRNAENQSAATLPEQLEQIKIKTMQAIVQDELFYQQSLGYKIIVSDAELKNDIQSSAMFRNTQNQFDANIYYSFLNSIKMSPKDYETMRKKRIAAEKLKLLLASAIKVSDSEYEAAEADGIKMTREEFMHNKVNMILSEWYFFIISHSKIVTNDSIFKQI